MPRAVTDSSAIAMGSGAVAGADWDTLVPRMIPAAILIACFRDRDVALLGEPLDAYVGRIVAVGKQPDACHTRRPGRTPASRIRLRLDRSAPIVVGAPWPG